VALLSGFTGYVFPLSDYPSKTGTFTKGETFSPLKSFDFDSGDWTVYLCLSHDDFPELHPSVTRAIGFKSTDIDLLKKAQESWRFTYSGGDMATVTSEIYFVRDGKLVFKTGIVIDKSIEGLQSQEFGWVEPKAKNAITDFVKQFERVYWPIVFL
jgi:hypothetical protein